MTSMFSIILVIVMAFSSIGGMSTNQEEASFFEAKVGLDMQTVLAMSGAGTADNSEETAQMVKVIEDVLNAVTIKGVADKGVTELDLYAGEDLLASIGVKNSADGATLASSLLGSQVIFCSNELIEQMTQQMTGSMVQTSGNVDAQALMDQMQNLDWNQIGADFGEVFEKVGQVITEKTGEPENGEYSVDGAAFTVKVPVNITYMELMELLLTSAKELAGKESVKPLLDTLAKDQDLPAEIDKALEELKNQTPEQQYDLSIASYADEKGSSYFVFDLTRPASEDGAVQADNMHVGAGQVEGQTKVLIISGEQFTFDMTAASAADGSVKMDMNLVGQGIAAAVTVNSSPDGNCDVLADAQIQGMPIRSHTVTTPDGDKVDILEEVFMMSMDKPLFTLNATAGKGGEIVSAFEGENIKTVPFDTLMDPENQTASTQLSMTMMASLLKAVTTLTKNLPEDTAAWVNTQVKQMMSPDAPVTKTTEGE